MTHIDDWLDTPSFDEKENYAKFVIEWYRMKALKKLAYSKWMEQFKLFGTYKWKLYKITGASSLGDVFIATDLSREYGYDLRVNIDELSDFKGEI